MKIRTKKISLAPMKTRAVSFNMNLNTTYEVHRLSRKDKAAAWFSNEEYDSIKASFAQILFLMEVGNDTRDFENDENSALGLEKHAWEGKWESLDQKRAHYDVVLDEQERQSKMAKKSPIKMCKACEATTAETREAALARAKNLEIDIREYLNDIRLLFPKVQSSLTFSCGQNEKKELMTKGNLVDTRKRSSQRSEGKLKKLFCFNNSWVISNMNSAKKLAKLANIVGRGH